MTGRSRPARRDDDSGSITPLLIGMVVCLLVLGVGVIAMGSVVLARRSLQSACDSTVSLITGRQTQGGLTGGRGVFDREARAELSRRIPGATATTDARNSALVADCTVEAPVAFGALFGNPTAMVQVRSVSQVQRG